MDNCHITCVTAYPRMLIRRAKEVNKVFLVGKHPKEFRDKLGISVNYRPIPTIEEAIVSKSCTNGALIILPEKVGNDEVTIAALLLYRGDKRFSHGNQPTETQVESLFEIRSHGGLNKVMTNMPYQVQIGILIGYLEGMV